MTSGAFDKSMRTLKAFSIGLLVFAAAEAAAPVSPEAVTMVRPTYPPEAQRAGIQGCAVLQFDVSANGVPEGIRVVSATPYPEFGDAARKALQQWRFRPFEQGGEAAVFHNATQAFAFTLPGKGAGPACGNGAAVSAVAGNSALPPLPPPPLQPAHPKPSSAPSPATAPSPVPPPAAPPAAPSVPPATVTVNVTRPAVVQTYTAVANQSRAPTGRVTVRFCVNAQGKTERLKVVKSVPYGTFDETALRIIRAAEFKPYEVNGSPVVACGITQEIVFKPTRPGG